jgi:diaminohydroxyphosphoribosylaminopyrimidine deaminase / 5-amino-6-(5-phosphoribosylamino)uracil reductase
MSINDSHWMSMACVQANKGLTTTTPNPRVGCVIVSADGHLVGTGFHRAAGEAHAEVNALAEAGERAVKATAYVTLEPCNHQGRTGACTEALIAAGISAVVYGMTDPNPIVNGKGIERLRSAGLEVRGPVNQQECMDLNPGFIKRMSQNRPLVRCKLASSLDGRTAMANGESHWISGPAARADVQHWRARSCAIVTGVGTVLQDDPAMTVRMGENPRQPLRVIVDSQLRTPSSARMLTQELGQTVIATCASHRPAALVGPIWGLPSRNGQVDLEVLLDRLAEQGCNEVLIEAGARLSGAFLQAGLVDELIVYLAPTVMGSSACPMFDWPISSMSERLLLEWIDVVPIGKGNDWRFRARPKKLSGAQ